MGHLARMQTLPLPKKRYRQSLPGQVESVQGNEDHIHSRVCQHHQMKTGRSIPGHMK